MRWCRPWVSEIARLYETLCFQAVVLFVTNCGEESPATFFGCATLLQKVGLSSLFDDLLMIPASIFGDKVSFQLKFNQTNKLWNQEPVVCAFICSLLFHYTEYLQFLSCIETNKQFFQSFERLAVFRPPPTTEDLNSLETSEFPAVLQRTTDLLLYPRRYSYHIEAPFWPRMVKREPIRISEKG